MTIFGKVILGLIIITGVAFIIKGPSKDESSNLENTQNQEGVVSEEVVLEDNSSQENVFTGSITELLARGGDYKCEYSFDSENSSSSGIVYISGNKLKGDFTTDEKITQSKIKSYMINDGEFSYVWSSMVPSGFKVKNSSETETQDSQSMQGFDQNQRLDYKCEAWGVDSSVFNLPEGVTFNEIKS